MIAKLKQINKKTIIIATSTIIAILLIFSVGIFLGRYLQTASIVVNKNNLYLANQVTIKTTTQKSKANSNAKLQLRYKPTNDKKWVETTPKLGIETANQLIQSFDLSNLKTATTYQYQTKTINNNGISSDWTAPIAFATAREKGVSTSNAALVYTEANNPDNPGDITFNGKVMNADFYVWDFGDGNKSNDLVVNAAATNHIYETGGDVTATLTAYKYVPVSDNLFDKQAKYSGRTIVAQKEANFFVNLPIPVVIMNEDGSIKIGAGNIPVTTQPQIALTNQEQAVLGETAPNPAQCNLNQLKITGPSQLVVDQEAGYTVDARFNLRTAQTKIDLSENLKTAGCQIIIPNTVDCVNCVNANRLPFRVKCSNATKGELIVSYFTEGGNNRESTIPCLKKLSLSVTGGESCDNSVWVSEGGKCILKENQCGSVLDQCKCGLTSVTAIQDPVNPLKYTFTLLTPTESNAKSFKLDFGDATDPQVSPNKTFTHTYVKSGQYQVVARSYTEEIPGKQECGRSSVLVNPATCKTGTFTADKYSGDTASGPIPVTFSNSGAINVASYVLKYGDKTNNGTGLFAAISNHSYASPGTYQPALEGKDLADNSCGVVSLDKPLKFTGPAPDGSCGLGLFTVIPSSGEATAKTPLKVTATAEIVKPTTNQKIATEYQLDWGDNTGVVTKNIPNRIPEKPLPNKLTFDHSYTGPNQNSADGSYTAILQAFRRDEKGVLINCGSKAVVIKITNATNLAPAASCQFDGKLIAKPKAADPNEKITFIATNIKKGDNAKNLPNLWQYNFGDSTISQEIIGKIDGQRIDYRYKDKKTYSVTLTGYYKSPSGKLNCGSIATTVAIGVSAGTQLSSCSIGTLTVVPGKVNLKEEITATLTKLSGVDSVNIDWGDKTPPENQPITGKTTLTTKHTYDAIGQYTITMTGSTTNLTSLCGEVSKEVVVGEKAINYATQTALGGDITLSTATSNGANPLITNFEIKDKDGKVIAAPNVGFSIVVTQVGFESDPEIILFDDKSYKFCGPDVQTTYKVKAVRKATASDAEATSNEINITINSSSDKDKCDTTGVSPVNPVVTPIPTVAIGTQAWMKKNLDVGTMINASVNQANNLIVEKHCNNNDAENCAIYGGLYQWNEMMQYSTVQGTQGICPNGFHLPTDTEWKTLEMFLGMTQAQADESGMNVGLRGFDEGAKLKIGGSSGFDALGGGASSLGSSGLGLFVPPGNGYYSTSTLLDKTNMKGMLPCLDTVCAWDRILSSNDDSSRRGYNSVNAGFSVRCLKN